MEIRTAAVIIQAGIIAVCLGVSMLTLSRASNHRTPTHTEEHHHGNHWSTWHTLRTHRVQMVCAAIGMITAIPGAGLIVLLLSP